jgi:hypothetical protein
MVVGDFARRESYVVGVVSSKGDPEGLPKVEGIVLLIRRKQKRLAFGELVFNWL